MHQQSKGRDGRTCRGRRRKQLMILLVDNYDSFSYNLYQLAGSINPDMKVIRNDEMTIDEIRALAPASIILSPGPGRPEQAGRMHGDCRKIRRRDPDPRCLPRPSGNLCRVRRDRHLCETADARQTVRDNAGSYLGIIPGLPETVPVARYHSLAADEATLPETLKVTARTADGEVMAVEDSEKRSTESSFIRNPFLTPQGRQMVENFLKLQDRSTGQQRKRETEYDSGSDCKTGK